MLIAIIIILIVLYILGYVPIGGFNIPNTAIININNHQVTLWELLILLVIAWAIGVLPNPFRTIASILLVLWVLSVLGFIAVANLSNILIIVIILGLIVSLFL